MNFIDVLKVFNEDFEIYVVIMIGEIGGIVEEEVVEWVKVNMIKFVVGFIGGKIVFFGKCMGYVGVIIFGGKGMVEEKVKMMNVCGIEVVEIFFVMGEILIKVLKEKGLFEMCKIY